MRSGWVGMGPETIAFENELAIFTNAPEVVTVNSCTSALFLALLVEGVGAGDEVIVPSLTWRSTANAALYVGATPVFCDVDYSSMCMSPENIIAKLSVKTKAVIVVHYGGYAVDVIKLRRLLPENVIIIEDSAHALGSTYQNGANMGSSGNLTCFSFYANKNVSTAEGGAIALFDTAKAERLRSLRMSGMSSNAWSRYINPNIHSEKEMEELGYKMNYTDLQAAIGRVQLKRFHSMAKVRKTIALEYKKKFEEEGVDIPFQSCALDESHARHLLVGRINKKNIGVSRDYLFTELRSRNIGVSIHYQPLHMQPIYSRSDAINLPVTEHLYSEIMTLPISACMTLDDVNYVTKSIASVIKKLNA